ncbi:helix-turn-helix domain-containing protein [Corynebacterium pygosceleis]|uniref:Helix-turn-helix domain-containing protein n=1 Tax=Corynebacterium pygosceleis TaxID=2800406 RepID=A0A9Q4C834_9CORY|nr:helix-turn-helix domain-containing protein [Corynebacterium pygosceleis]MCK7637220.1 helix-turn-helix domain-containing protein [Corynebacterium pygosceleis]MCK7676157.1 helix-turn-helix domain-containing protein [Corynebacterium pygosceleis]MCL0120005.1 helix-turn-helix domain-containing protein [Corynebacterium pygosceleis]MCX7445123.1 helix-turn-helix domain-containing protein [Corynebacterium pygosceleis]MCX7468452.1 helix-turn-helix domain-containing protein [Corynebacterium pygoscelei
MTRRREWRDRSVPQEYTYAEWCEIASSSFSPLRVTTSTPDTFRVTVQAVQVGDVGIMDLRSPAHGVDLDDSHIDVRQEPWCKLCLQISGQLIVRQDGRVADTRPGDLVFYETSRPFTLEYTSHQRSLMWHFPQSLLMSSRVNTTIRTATVLRGDSDLGQLAIPGLRSYADRLPALGSMDDAYATEMVHANLSGVLAAMSLLGKEVDGTATASTNALFSAATAYIEDHLGDPALSPAMIADNLFVSVRQLHARFRAESTTVGTYIRGRRLEEIRHALLEPRNANLSVAMLGARVGFHDASHLSKAFKARYGVSPSTYRRSRGLPLGNNR